MTASFLSGLSGRSHALVFAGQSTPWTQALADLRGDPVLWESLTSLMDEAETRLGPVSADLMKAVGRPVSVVAEAAMATGDEAESSRIPDSSDAAVSVPGIALAQCGAFLDLVQLGYGQDSRPRAVMGHSQGVLAARMVNAVLRTGSVDRARKDIVDTLMIARLIGAAATRCAGILGIRAQGEATPMLSVTGMTPAQARALIGRIPDARGPVDVAVVNDADRVVLSGYPGDLIVASRAADDEKRREAVERKAGTRGGSLFDPVMEYLDVTVPFHSPLMEPAVVEVRGWAEACGLDGDEAARLASTVLVEHVDWAAGMRNLLKSSSTGDDPLWILDMGPGRVLGRIVSSLAQGTGAGVVDASEGDMRERISTSDEDPERLQDWNVFLPHVRMVGGEPRLLTRFSDLTGKPPVLLAGMTPTTVDPGIVAAAANAGYWAELAGGGQVTAEVFDANMDRLSGLLQEGRSIEFNAMYMDRYLWGLQFGSSRIVPRRRAAGAPIDGVVVSAGIPALDEATRLVRDLQAEGFPYVAFKPGTVDQIRQVVAIAKEAAPAAIIMEVEGGQAGGHHSWESLDDLLARTYAQVRACDNIVLVAGGGMGTARIASRYLWGTWSAGRSLPPMPVDAVMIGTAAMTAREALTSPDVKRMLVNTPGLPASTGRDADTDPFAPREPWVKAFHVSGDMTSGMSHLHADIYEVENSSARCGRLLAHLTTHPEEMASRRQEIIAALADTAKPYFGDLETMTYEEWARRFADLCHPWADRTYAVRFAHLLDRIEARVCEQDSGTVESVLDERLVTEDPASAIDALVARYPLAGSLRVEPQDAAWFPELVREYPKPMPFVPVLDEDLLRWWGQDQLWQSQDPRYPADSVRVIPGPVSVAGITGMDEPVASILRRFERTAIDEAPRDEDVSTAISAVDAPSRVDDASRVDGASHVEAVAQALVRHSPVISWLGRMIPNPLRTQVGESDHGGELGRMVVVGHDGDDVLLEAVIDLDTYDGDRGVDDPARHAVRSMSIPLRVDVASVGRAPRVDRERLATDVRSLLAGTAGVGGIGAGGDPVEDLPRVDSPDVEHPFGVASYEYTWSRGLGADHEAATAGTLPDGLDPSELVPDALVGPVWPAIYAALGSIDMGGTPVIEGLLDAVHLDHMIRLLVPSENLTRYVGSRISVRSWAERCQESSSGRLVTIHVSHTASDGVAIAEETERFIIRGRVGSEDKPRSCAPYGGAVSPEDSVDVVRRRLRRVVISAPDDMTTFARTSGDFNPIHTSRRAARVAGLDAPLVHGMWLSAAVQHIMQATDRDGRAWRIEGWTYTMFGMVALRDSIEVTVERIGRVRHGGMLLEATCRVGDVVVSRGTARAYSPVTAFVYPGQGVQSTGMTLDERSSSPAVRDVWERADAVTRDRLGFSILAIVRDNPRSIVVNGTVLRHPDGLLNLTQFTQVALAVVAFAQTARLREAGADVWPAYYAGHSLGEYTALSSFASIIPLETVIELVYHRGSTMHHLIERDERGRSNYRMGALRPNQFGVGDDGVRDYVEGVARDSGEFLEIVNYNLEGSQYAVAGTIAGLKALKTDSERRAAEYGGKPPFMLVPGIDVPFHSTLLRKGVPEFRSTLDRLLPQDIDSDRLVGRYIPNLVARPFELTRDFARSILDVVPSEPVSEILNDPARWDGLASHPHALARVLLIELLCWQFASPVRWIETQNLLFSSIRRGGLGVGQLIEVGPGSAPTLANMAAKTLKLPRFEGVHVDVRNVGRDSAVVYMTDADIHVDPPVETVATALGSMASGDPGSSDAGASPMADTANAAHVAGPVEEPAVAAVPAESVADLDFPAHEAVAAVIAYEAKIRPDQIAAHDTTDTLTSGVSSRRNQLIMDMGVELGIPGVDGAADAPMSRLGGMVDAAAPSYRPFGQVLVEAVSARIREVFGASGMSRKDIENRVTSVWSLRQGWVNHVLLELCLGTREGESLRGGDLATLGTTVSDSASAQGLVDEAVTAVAASHGIQVSKPVRGSGSAVVDSAALDDYAARVTGPDGVLAATARCVLDQLGLSTPAPTGDVDVDARALAETVRAELGEDWPRQVAPTFDPLAAILFDDRWATAREDVARVYHEHDARAASRDFVGSGKAVHDEAEWFAGRSRRDGDVETANHLESIAADALLTRDAGKAMRFRSTIAVVTGVGPRSIAGAVVSRLLEEGATVIAVCHRLDDRMRIWARDMFRDHAGVESTLWLASANLSSYRDVDALVSWITSEQTSVSGATTTVVKPAYSPDVLIPFAAPRVHGSLEDSGPLFESQARLMLWGVERLIAGFAGAESGADVSHRMHVVLPGSPNRGVFGGDGAYGEVKGAFDALVARSTSESGWSSRVTFAHPLIGWVRGTGLMGGNDLLAAAAERHGLRTYSTEEMAGSIIDLATPDARRRATDSPLTADLTGGLGASPLDIRKLREEAARDSGSDNAVATEADREPAPQVPRRGIRVLPTPHVPHVVDLDPEQWGDVEARPDEMIVVVSVGELGPWGSGRTRFEAEMGLESDGTVELSAAAVLELAWGMGLIHWQDGPTPGWYDADDTQVPEEDIHDRFHDEVVARSGIRPFEEGMGGDYRDGADEHEVEVFLDHDVSFHVPDRRRAEEYVAQDPERTAIASDDDSHDWVVTRRRGSMIRVPRRAAMTRTVGGQIPDGFDPRRWGIPASMVGEVDPIALWNLVTAVDAFLSAGITPAQILRSVHPSQVADTQGTGFGGMRSMRRLYLDRFLGHDVPGDILQEALPNVVAAHVMQSYVGGYGAMVQPVSACATAAVSLEEACDKIALGKADVVVAGAIDDIGVESVEGFGNMNATANSGDMAAKGIAPRFFSRANDRRRGGFVESQGGGTVLVMRGDVALSMGLPVSAVVGYVHSFADGAHTSIPAPGLGALAAGLGGRDARLVRNLRRLGVSVDDIAVVSKHDTSTGANDPNESELHERLARAIGRSEGNPLLVVSQKTLTGHAKGGACVFQVNGLTQIFASGVVPGNKALDCVDPVMRRDAAMVWPRRALHLGLVRAALATSLGFGHVSAVVALVHPGAFEASVARYEGVDVLDRWRKRANARLAWGRRRLVEGMMGHGPLYEPIDNRRMGDAMSRGTSHDVESAMLLDPDARLGADGVYAGVADGPDGSDR